MATILSIDHKIFAISGLSIAAGVTVYSVYRLIRERKREEQTNVYESKKLLNEYLVFHFGTPDQVLKWPSGPKDSVDFPKRCADLCLKHFGKGNGVPSRALDIGCAVGRSSFELARMCKEVIGIDYSQSFVDACDQLKRDGYMDYSITEEGDLSTQLKAVIASDIDRTRTSFQQGDACSLPLNKLGQFGCVLAANLICRLHLPFDFLASLPGLVAPGGILVITSPYTWLEQFTAKSTWLGGYVDKSGNPVTGFLTLKKELSAHFELVETQDMPFFIRETARKNQWTVAHATVWLRKTAQSID